MFEVYPLGCPRSNYRFFHTNMSVSFIHKIVSTESVFYSKYKDLIKLKTRIGRYLLNFGSRLN